jgi:predicted dehydrogenase
MERKLGVGVVGLREGRTMIGALNNPVPAIVGDNLLAESRSVYTRVVAACDINPDKIAETNREFPDLFYTTDYQQMLAHHEIDIVAIFTPDQYHGEQIVQAFEAGKHVICTKPLVNSFEDARQILAAGRRTGCKLLVGQSIRFFESFKRQRQAYERGEIGSLELLDAHYIHRMDWFYDKSPWATSATDWVFLGLSHPIDLARWYLGQIKEVHAYGSQSALARRYNVQSFDIYTVNLFAADGQIGRVMGNYGLHELPSARNAIELTLFGSSGTSMAQYHDMRYFHTAPDGTEIQEDMLYTKRAYYFNNETHGMHYGEFANYADYFASALLNNVDYSPDLEEGIETFCVMHAVRTSARSGKPSEVEPFMEQLEKTV